MGQNHYNGAPRIIDAVNHETDYQACSRDDHQKPTR